MTVFGTFPFGQPVLKVEQLDRSPKRVFVLGVYASAVHAIWTSPSRRVQVRALAVASEPEIFWRGGNPDHLISAISIPLSLGTLASADKKYNGPSGRSLDEDVLHPLGVDRANAWLSDLVPHSCLNAQQHRAIKRAYLPVMTSHNLPQPSAPPIPKPLLTDSRREAILDEIRQSTAPILILLGDQPIRWFLAAFAKGKRTLSAFGITSKLYGRLHPFTLGGIDISVLPIAHPRQAAKLGQSSERWFRLHSRWMKDVAPKLL